MTRPNVLLITSDQHRPDCFGHAGRDIRTPNLDSLAANGTAFDCAITPNVLCQPARASILTGMLPSIHGVTDNRIDLVPQIGEQGWPSVLSRAGYRSAFIGKAHFGEDPAATKWGAPESRTDSAQFPEGWNGPYMGFDYVELMILGHWHPLLPCEQPPHGQHFERWFWEHEDAWKLWGRDARTGEDAHYGQLAAQTWTSALPAEWHSTTWVTERTNAFLRNADKNEPFCLWASFPDPHHPFDCPEPWASQYSPDEIDISPIHQLDLENRPWWHRAALERTPPASTERQRVLRTQYMRIPAQSDEQLASMTANYYGMISFIDHGVGQILATLKETGLAEKTIVIFTSDHGELLGDHGLYLKGPMMYDPLLRVGLFMQGPGVPVGRRIADPVSTMDLAATFCDWSESEPPAGIQSRSLLPIIQSNLHRDFAYNEWDLGPSRCGVALELRTVRTMRHRMTVDQISGDGELYDLSHDPYEMQNLFNDPSASDTRSELRDMIARAQPL